MKKENVVVKKGCHSQGMLSEIFRVLGSCCYSIKVVILDLIQDLQRLLWSFINGVRGRSRIKYGMTPNRITTRGFTARTVIPQCRCAGYSGRVGFTLIELLVVVLIIGILAAVAVPQYQKAVDKTHMMVGISLLSTLYKAQKAYYLAQGKYNVRLEELDIDFPSSGCTIYGNFNHKIFCPQHFIEIHNTLNSDTLESNPGGIHIAFCPGETIAENCVNQNSVVWYLEHHPLTAYQNRVICYTKQERSKPLCDYVKALVNK